MKPIRSFIQAIVLVPAFGTIHAQGITPREVLTQASQEVIQYVKSIPVRVSFDASVAIVRCRSQRDRLYRGIRSSETRLYKFNPLFGRDEYHLLRMTGGKIERSLEPFDLVLQDREWRCEWGRPGEADHGYEARSSSLVFAAWATHFKVSGLVGSAGRDAWMNLRYRETSLGGSGCDPKQGDTRDMAKSLRFSAFGRTYFTLNLPQANYQYGDYWSVLPITGSPFMGDYPWMRVREVPDPSLPGKQGDARVESQGSRSSLGPNPFQE